MARWSDPSRRSFQSRDSGGRSDGDQLRGKLRLFARFDRTLELVWFGDEIEDWLWAGWQWILRWSGLWRIIGEVLLCLWGCSLVPLWPLSFERTGGNRVVVSEWMEK
jgi:hypothetical protein